MLLFYASELSVFILSTSVFNFPVQTEVYSLKLEKKLNSDSNLKEIWQENILQLNITQNGILRKTEEKHEHKEKVMEVRFKAE